MARNQSRRPSGSPGGAGGQYTSVPRPDDKPTSGGLQLNHHGLITTEPSAYVPPTDNPRCPQCNAFALPEGEVLCRWCYWKDNQDAVEAPKTRCRRCHESTAPGSCEWCGVINQPPTEIGTFPRQIRSSETGKMVWEFDIPPWERT